MKIKTQRLKIRELKRKDVDPIHQMTQSAETLKFEAWGPYTRPEALNFVEKAKTSRREKNRQSFDLGICLLETKAIIGLCFLEIEGRKIAKARIGYMIDPKFWGSGYATEATLALIDQIQKKFSINNFYTSCDSENAASLRILRKCGFEEVAMNAELEPVKGRFRDMIQFELKLQPL